MLTKYTTTIVLITFIILSGCLSVPSLRDTGQQIGQEAQNIGTNINITIRNQTQSEPQFLIDSFCKSKNMPTGKWTGFITNSIICYNNATIETSEYSIDEYKLWRSLYLNVTKPSITHI